MMGIEAKEMTLLMTVGWPNNPSTAGSGGSNRTRPRLPSRLSNRDVAAPQT